MRHEDQLSRDLLIIGYKLQYRISLLLHRDDFNVHIDACNCASWNGSHEDGSVCFWDVGGYSLRFVHRVSTSGLFFGEFSEPSGEREEEEAWPPFKKVMVNYSTF